MSDEQTADPTSRTDPAPIDWRLAGFWLSSVAAIGLIIGGVAPWAAYLGYWSVSGTHFHGWNDVAAGVLALVMLGVHHQRRLQAPLLVAAVLGALAAIGAVMALAKIGSDGTITVFGVAYRYLNPDWGVYLVLASGIGLACSATLTWLSARGSG